MADQFGRAGALQESAEVLLIFRIRFGIHRDRGIRHHLLQHPDAAGGAQRQSDGITGPGIEFGDLAGAVHQSQNRSEGVVLDGMHDHPLEAQAAGGDQAHHQIVAQRPGWALAVEAGEDVLGLGLIDPDRHLATTGWVTEQHDRAAAGGVEGDASDLHFDHGLLCSA